MANNVGATYKDRRDRVRSRLAQGQKQAVTGTERKAVGGMSTEQVLGDVLQKMARPGVSHQAVAKLQPLFLPEASDAEKFMAETMVTKPPSWEKLTRAHDILASSRR